MKWFCYYSTSAEMETMFKRNWNTSNFENANVKTFSMIPFAVKNKHEKMRKVMQDKCIEEIEPNLGSSNPSHNIQKRFALMSPMLFKLGFSAGKYICIYKLHYVLD